MIQSNRAKNHPSTGGDPEIEDQLTGGNKHSSSGGGRDEHSSPRNAASREAAGNDGIEAGDPGKSTDEGGGGSQTSQGPSLTRGS